MGDDHDPGRIRGMYDVARVHQTNSGASIDGRNDACVSELGARIVDLRLVDLQLGGQLIDSCACGVDSLLARQVLRLQNGIALEVTLGVRQLRGIPRLGGDCLVERRLIGSWVDLCQEIAFLDLLPLDKSDLLQFSVDPGSDGHGVESLDGAESLQVDRNIGVFDLRRIHRDGGAADLLLCGIGGFVQHAAPGDDQQHEHDQHAGEFLAILE